MTEHSITVRKLRQLLDALLIDDLLVVNQVRNFAIIRGGEQIGFVDLMKGNQHIEFYDAE